MIFENGNITAQPSMMKMYYADTKINRNRLNVLFFILKNKYDHNAIIKRYSIFIQILKL